MTWNSQGDESASPLDRAIERRLEEGEAGIERVQSATTAALSYVHFFLVPVFALLVMGLYPGRRFYVEHLVFALHYGAFAFFIWALVFLFSALDPPAPLAAGVVLAAFTWMLVHLYLALRRVYGGSAMVTAGKWAALCLLYGFVTALAVAGVTLAALWIA